MSVAASVGSSVARAVASSVARTAGGFDADAVAYFAAVEAAGGSFDLTGVNATYTTSYVKKAHSDLFAGLKADGLWTKITELYLLSGKTYAGMAVKAKGSGTLTLTNFVSGDYVSAGSGAGLKGNGSNKYIDSARGAEAVGNSGMSAYVTQAVSGTFDTLMGLDQSNVNTHHIRTTAGVTSMQFTSSSGVSGTVPPSFTTGLYCAVEDGSNLLVYLNGVFSVDDPVTSRADTGLPVGIFALRRNAGYTDYGDARISVASIHKALTDTDAANLSTRINAFMTALGANVY